MSRRNIGSIVVVLALMAHPEVVASGDPPSNLKNRLEAATKFQADVRGRLNRGLEGETTAEVRKSTLDRFYADTARNIGEILSLARAYPRDPAAVEALRFVIDTSRAGPGDESYQALEILLRDHVRDPGMGNLCARIFYLVHAPIAGSLIRSVLANHPDRYDRAIACHMLATYLSGQARMVRRIREQPDRIDHFVHERFKPAALRIVKEADPDALEREAESLRERILFEFADIVQEKASRPLGSIAAGELFAARNLGIGMLVPEIVGEDHEGKAFRLSDFRGKVTVLSFSGDWCGPCVAMYPQERDMVARLDHRSFALVSVNTDSQVETLRRSIAKGEITWRCWWDGGPEGPITTRWGIEGFPSIFVLDRAGRIRFKDVRGPDLDRAVGTLLAEQSPQGQ